MGVQALHLITGLIFFIIGTSFTARRYVFYKSGEKSLKDSYIISMNAVILLGLIMIIYGMTIVIINTATPSLRITAQDIFTSDGVLKAVPEDIVLTIIILLILLNGIVYLFLGRKELEREQVQVSISIIVGSILLFFAVIMIIVFSIGT